MKKRGYKDGIVRYPTSVIDHIKQSQDPVSEDVNELKEWKEQQESAVPDNVIKGIREIENFLKNTPDTETLTQLLSNLTTSIENAVLKSGTTSASPMTGALYFSNNSYIKNASGDVVAKVNKFNCFGNVYSTSRIRSLVPVDRVGVSETVHMVESPSIVTIVTLTQAQYDALATKDANTEYNIIESV